VKYYQNCIKFACNYFINSVDFGGLCSPDPLPGLRPWTPLGTPVPQTACGFAPSTANLPPPLARTLFSPRPSLLAGEEEKPSGLSGRPVSARDKLIADKLVVRRVGTVWKLTQTNDVIGERRTITKQVKRGSANSGKNCVRLLQTTRALCQLLQRLRRRVPAPFCRLCVRPSVRLSQLPWGHRDGGDTPTPTGSGTLKRKTSYSFQDLLLSPISQHSVRSELTSHNPFPLKRDRLVMLKIREQQWLFCCE